jgi:hypothetical protein
MTLSQRRPELEWNARIQDYLESPCMKRYRHLIANHPFKTNMDFIKTVFLHKLRVLYFMTAPALVKESMIAYILNLMLESDVLRPFCKDDAFKNYLSDIIKDLIEQGNGQAEKYVKYDLMLSVKHFGYSSKAAYESIMINLCEKQCEGMSFTNFTADKAKLDHITTWAEKNFAHRKTSQNAQIIGSYLWMGMFFGITMLGGLVLSLFKDYSLTGFLISVPSTIFGGLYFRHYREQNGTSIKNCNKALVMMAMDLVGIKLKRVKHKIKFELNVNLDVTPLRGETEEHKHKPISGHSYARILPPLQIQEPKKLANPTELKTTSSVVEIIAEDHIRFPYQDKIVEAYLSQDDLPIDKAEVQAIIKAFQKGLMPASKMKSVHAIVQDDKDSFKIRTSYDARMRGSYRVIDDKSAEIVFNNYDSNAHNAKRAKKGKTPVRECVSTPAVRFGS